MANTASASTPGSGSGLFGAIASIFGSILSFVSQERANRINIEEAQKNRDFQKDMSSTAYQRGVADMQAAGLNPGMMYGQSGMQSSTPAGSAASGIQPIIKGMEVQNLANAMLTFKQAKLTDAEIEKTEAETDKTDAETDNILEDTERIRLLNEWYPRLSGAQVSSLNAGTSASLSTAELNRAHTITAQLENEWIPRLRAANLSNINSQTALNQVNKFLADWDLKFRKEYGVRPGDSAVVDVTAFLCQQLGIDASDAIHRIKDFVTQALGLSPDSDGAGLESLGLGKDDKDKFRWLLYLTPKQIARHPELLKKRFEIFGY